MKKVLVSLAVLNLALVGCSSTKEPAPAPAPTPTPAPAAPAPAPTPKPTPTPTPVAVDPTKTGQLAKRSVYFDYDKYEVRDEFKPTVEAHGRFLASNPARSVRVEGNADDRGSREYNLALGQKRSEAVRRALTSFGASEKQIEATSNGKEKPKALGKDEASYAENRRGDIFYAGE